MLMTESLEIGEMVRDAMRERYGAEALDQVFRAFDTICSATQERQDALHAMLDATPPDVLVVIGGYNSSNTTHLLEIGLARGIPTFHIQDASRILGASSIRHQPLHAAGETETADWLPARPLTIGVTAGASTPNAEIERVIRRVAEVRGIALS